MREALLCLQTTDSGLEKQNQIKHIDASSPPIPYLCVEAEVKVDAQLVLGTW